MFSNFIYFIIVLLIYSTYQPPEEPNFDSLETMILFLVLTILFSVFCRLRFLKIEKNMASQRFAQLDHQFNGSHDPIISSGNSSFYFQCLCPESTLHFCAYPFFFNHSNASGPCCFWSFSCFTCLLSGVVPMGYIGEST
jgi:hypothetical protein